MSLTDTIATVEGSAGLVCALTLIFGSLTLRLGSG
jgi:hypothetical protein